MLAQMDLSAAKVLHLLIQHFHYKIGKIDKNACMKKTFFSFHWIWRRKFAEDANGVKMRSMHTCQLFQQFAF